MGAAPSARLVLTALPGIPLIEPGDDLAAVLAASLDRAGLALATGDVLVVAQKVVSKAENRYVDLAGVTPSPQARAIGEEIGKDPRAVEVILGESAAVVRTRERLMVVEHRLGYVMANAGADASNIDHLGRERLLLLPADPDASCRRLRAALHARTGAWAGVIINDSLGRAWRKGITGHALGVAGLPAVVDERGHPDLFGRPLQVTQVALADELAAAASLLQGQGDQGRPVVLIQGLALPPGEGSGRDLIRPRDQDLFR
jgi:coenzyme F420-0:L-glutamate ligase/coenzyme F420-1:gamma-L-glutamate ligase